jgi:hypothetical protein
MMAAFRFITSPAKFGNDATMLEGCPHDQPTMRSRINPPKLRNPYGHGPNHSFFISQTFHQVTNLTNFFAPIHQHSL